MSTLPTISSITIAGQSIAAGGSSTVSATAAGSAVTFAGNGAVGQLVQFEIYFPDGHTPGTVRNGRLPASLVNGKYKLDVRYTGLHGETPPNTSFWLTVAAADNTASISGVCFNDDDADGIFDVGEQPSGVRIAFIDANGNGRLDAGEISVSSDASGRYSITGLAPGTYRITRVFPAGYRLSNNSLGYVTVTLAAGQHTTVDIGTTSKPLPANPSGGISTGTIGQTDGNTPQSVVPFWANGFGGCFDYNVDAKDDPTAALTATRAKAIGLTHLRSFGPSCTVGGKLDAGYINKVRRITARGMRVVVMHGAPEGDPAHTTYDEDDWKRYFAAVAIARNGDPLYEIELQNEFNLSKYWPLGAGAAFSAAAAAKMIAIAKIARAALGNDAYIIGPSIGWGAAIDPHLTYQKAFVDGGGINYVDAINTHFYFSQASMAVDVLGQYRAWVGKKPICLTETNIDKPIEQYAAAAPAFVTAYQSAGVTPFVYRFDAQAGNVWNDRSLYDSAGNLNSVVASALKLRAAA